LFYLIFLYSIAGLGVFILAKVGAQRLHRPTSIYGASLFTLCAGLAAYWCKNDFGIKALEKHPYFALAVFMLPCTLFLAYSNKRLSRYYILCIALPFTATLIEEVLGSNQPPYYTQYMAPAFLGMFFIEYFSSCSDKTPLQNWLRISGSALLILLISYSTFLFVTTSYRGESSISTTTLSNSPLLKYSSLSKARAESIDTVISIYRSNSCENHFFAALDRTPIFYWLLTRPSPFGVSWTGDRIAQYAAVIRAQESACIVFREGWQQQSTEGQKAFLRHLNLPEKVEYRFEQAGSEGVSMLIFATPSNSTS
jgi:hypothetical protein